MGINVLKSDVRFGWSKNSPPPLNDCLISIDRNDIASNAKGLFLNRNIVRQASDNLVRSHDKSPGFFGIVGAKNVLKKREKVLSLQYNFVSQVLSDLQNRYKKQFNPENYRLKLNFGELNGVKNAFLLNDAGAGVASNKMPHFDAFSPVFSLAYGPFHNIKKNTGQPMLFDAKQYCKDNQLNIKDTIERLPNKVIVTFKKEHAKNLMPYSLSLDQFDAMNDYPFVLVNNRIEEGGVAHGAVFPKRINPTQQAIRQLRPVDVDPVIDLERIDWHNKLGLTAPKGNTPGAYY
jgi:hypothetical protein